MDEKTFDDVLESDFSKLVLGSGGLILQNENGRRRKPQTKPHRRGYEIGAST